jgi:HlyD family secretion protein
LVHEPDLTATLGLAASSARSRLRHWLPWALLAVAAIAAAWWVIQSRGAVPSIEYRTEAIARGPLVITVTATGSLEPLTQVNVGTETSGIIESVAVDDNDAVTAGQVLATLNTDKLRAQRLQAQAAHQAAEARVSQARATLAEARLELARLEEMWTLSRGQLPARRDIDQARTTLQRAEADETSAVAGVAQAAASLSAIEIDLRKATIRSPITGIVLDRQVDPGQTVAASFQTPTLFTLAEDLVRMRLSVAVDEADIGSVAIGQHATFTVDAYPDRRFSSTVVEIRSLPETVSGVVTYEARLDVDNADLVLRPGMTATADITVTEIAGALLLPNAALRFQPPATEDAAPADDRGLIGSLMPRPPGRGGRAGTAAGTGTTAGRGRIWTMENGALTQREIATGVTDGTWTEIRDDSITEGTRVVVDYMTRGAS